MDAGDWITIGFGLVGLAVQLVVVAVVFTRVQARTEGNSRAIEELKRNTLTTKEGDGYQAQLNRLEQRDSECEGKLQGLRQEFADRSERMSTRLTAHEQTQSTQNTALTGAITELRATFAASMQSMKESVDRLLDDRDRSHPAPSANPLMDQLQTFVAVSKMLRELSPNHAGAAH